MNRKETQQLIEDHRDTWWAWAQRCWPTLVKLEKPSIIINARLTSTGGRNFSESRKIDISWLLLRQQTEYAFTQVIPHEIAHQIDFDLYGWHKGEKHHRQTWVNIMIKMRLDPHVCLLKNIEKV